MKSLSDIVGAAGLQVYAEIALIIFFVVFVLVAVRVLLTRSRELDRVARLPLDDDDAIALNETRAQVSRGAQP